MYGFGFAKIRGTILGVPITRIIVSSLPLLLCCWRGWKGRRGWRGWRVGGLEGWGASSWSQTRRPSAGGLSLSARSRQHPLQTKLLHWRTPFHCRPTTVAKGPWNQVRPLTSAECASPDHAHLRANDGKAPRGGQVLTSLKLKRSQDLH